MVLQVQITASANVNQVARRLAEAGTGANLRRNLTRTLRAEAEPAVQATRSAVRSVPVRGYKSGRKGAHGPSRSRSRGMRAAIAGVVKSQVNYRGAGVALRIFVDVARLAATWRTLPKHLDDPKGWRHPVYGHRDRWVKQTGRPWFWTTIKKFLPGMRRGLVAAVDATTRSLR